MKKPKKVSHFKVFSKWVRIGKKPNFRTELRADRAEQKAERQYTDSQPTNLIMRCIAMKKNEINWDEIPDVITKEQLYQICHISKATAQYLLQSGLIPCEYTGKQTRCYKIKKEDVITYLEQREIVPENYSATAGWYGGVYRQIMLENAPAELLEDMRNFYEKKLVEYKDVISVPEIVILTGYGKTTVNRWCQKKKLKSFQKNGVNQVPKIYLIDFFCSQHFRTIVRKSRWHVRILNEFSRQGKPRKYSKVGGAE